jgi:hypothetical protein
MCKTSILFVVVEFSAETRTTSEAEFSRHVAENGLKVMAGVDELSEAE